MNKRRRYKAKARRRAKHQPPMLMFHRKAFELMWPMIPASPLTVDVLYGVGYFRGASPLTAGAGQTGETITTDGWSRG